MHQNTDLESDTPQKSTLMQPFLQLHNPLLDLLVPVKKINQHCIENNRRKTRHKIHSSHRVWHEPERQSRTVKQANTKAAHQVVHTQAGVQLEIVRKERGVLNVPHHREDVEDWEKDGIDNHQHGQRKVVSVFEDGADYRQEKEDVDLLEKFVLLFAGDLEAVVHLLVASVCFICVCLCGVVLVNFLNSKKLGYNLQMVFIKVSVSRHTKQKISFFLV